MTLPANLLKRIVFLVFTAFSTVPAGAADCNQDGIGDAEEVAHGDGRDCNQNGIPDDCEIASGALDCNGNGVPDECETLPRFRLPAPIVATVARDPVSLTLFDMDGDGDLDAAAAAYEADSLSILENLGGGRFGTAARIPVGLAPTWVEAADLDGDGRPDLVNSNRFTDNVSIHRNLGGGAFSPPRFHAATIQPQTLVAADFDGDGDIDLAAGSFGRCCPPEGEWQSAILWNLGDGSFAAGDAVPGLARAAADLDGDGEVDLATALVTENSSALLLLLNNGGGFRTRQLLSEMPGSVQIADFNGDSVPDLAAALEDRVLVLLNWGGASFRRPLIHPVELAPAQLAAADLDGDGFIDLAMVNAITSQATLLLNRGDGVLAEQRIFSVGEGPRAVRAGDLDGDGLPDVAAAMAGPEGPGHELLFLRNLGEGRLAAIEEVPVAGDPLAVVSADFNGDGVVDLAAATRTPPGISLLLGLGEGSFSQPQRLSTAQEPSSMAAGDLDGNGAPDLAIAVRRTQEAGVLWNRGGLLRSIEWRRVGGAPVAMEIADLDGDGRLDLITADVAAGLNGQAGLSLYFGGAASLEAEPAQIRLGADPSAFIIRDLDADGALDVAILHRFSNLLTVTLNRTGRRFAAPLAWTLERQPNALAALDIDRDGFAELVTAQQAARTLAILRNAGGGSFDMPEFLALTAPPSVLEAADLDKDGNEDLAVASWSPSGVAILLNRRGTLSKPEGYAGGAGPRSLEAVDIDADGFPELIAANGRSRSISIYRNLTLPPASPDCDGDGILDECQRAPEQCKPLGDCRPDCNLNGIADDCDLAAGTSADCDRNGVPDECDIARGYARDCNRNGIPDRCEIAQGSAHDLNRNGVPDACEELFRRGDTDSSGRLDIGDPLLILGYLFLDAELGCLDAGDANDDGRLDLSDAIGLLGFLFLGSAPLPGPFPGCGVDSTPDELDCRRHASCTHRG
jgi:hypothetical protein